MTMTPVDHFWSLTLALTLIFFGLSHATPINRQVGISENVFITVQNDTYGIEQRVCSIDSMTYGDGETIPTQSPCEHCICRPPGFACTIISCEYRPGCKAYKRSNQCCPEYQCECEKEGKIYQNGEKIMDSNNPCEICYCQGGEINCAVIDCYWRSDCQPRYIENRCCPLYDHCPPPNNQGPFSRPSIPTTTTASGFPWLNLSSAVYEISSTVPPSQPPSQSEVVLVSSPEPSSSVQPSTESVSTSIPVAPELVIMATEKAHPMEVNILATSQDEDVQNEVPNQESVSQVVPSETPSDNAPVAPQNSSTILFSPPAVQLSIVPVVEEVIVTQTAESENPEIMSQITPIDDKNHSLAVANVAELGESINVAEPEVVATVEPVIQTTTTPIIIAEDEPSAPIAPQNDQNVTEEEKASVEQLPETTEIPVAPVEVATVSDIIMPTTKESYVPEPEVVTTFIPPVVEEKLSAEFNLPSKPEIISNDESVEITTKAPEEQPQPTPIVANDAPISLPGAIFSVDSDIAAVTEGPSTDSILNDDSPTFAPVEEIQMTDAPMKDDVDTESPTVSDVSSSTNPTANLEIATEASIQDQPSVDTAPVEDIQVVDATTQTPVVENIKTETEISPQTEEPIVNDEISSIQTTISPQVNSIEESEISAVAADSPAVTTESADPQLVQDSTEDEITTKVSIVSKDAPLSTSNSQPLSQQEEIAINDAIVVPAEIANEDDSVVVIPLEKEPSVPVVATVNQIDDDTFEIIPPEQTSNSDNVVPEIQSQIIDKDDPSQSEKQNEVVNNIITGINADVNQDGISSDHDTIEIYAGPSAVADVPVNQASVPAEPVYATTTTTSQPQKVGSEDAVIILNSSIDESVGENEITNPPSEQPSEDDGEEEQIHPDDQNAVDDDSEVIITTTELPLPVSNDEVVENSVTTLAPQQSEANEEVEIVQNDSPASVPSNDEEVQVTTTASIQEKVESHDEIGEIPLQDQVFMGEQTSVVSVHNDEAVTTNQPETQKDEVMNKVQKVQAVKSSVEDSIEFGGGSLSSKFRLDLFNSAESVESGSGQARTTVSPTQQAIDDVVFDETPVATTLRPESRDNIEVTTTGASIEGRSEELDMVSTTLLPSPSGELRADAEQAKEDVTTERVSEDTILNDDTPTTSAINLARQEQVQTTAEPESEIASDFVEVSTTSSSGFGAEFREDFVPGTTNSPSKFKAEAIEKEEVDSTTVDIPVFDEEPKTSNSFNDEISIATTYQPVTIKAKSEPLGEEITTESILEVIQNDDVTTEIPSEVQNATTEDSTQIPSKLRHSNVVSLAHMMIPEKGISMPAVSDDLVKLRVANGEEMSRSDITDSDSWLVQTAIKHRKMSGFPEGKRRRRMPRQTSQNEEGKKDKTYFKKTKKPQEPIKKPDDKFKPFVQGMRSL